MHQNERRRLILLTTSGVKVITCMGRYLQQAQDPNQAAGASGTAKRMCNPLPA